MSEAAEKVRLAVGGRAYNALKRGRSLIRWRQSTPHNWFIERADGNGYLWHSCPGEKFPPLHLFDRIQKDDSIEVYVLKESVILGSKQAAK
jgi:hypothetical protein